VSRPPLEFDPYRGDPARWGVSMAQVTEIMLACLDAAEAKSIAEVGAFAGDLTSVLVVWAAGAEARVQAIDPAPQPELERLAAEYPDLELVRKTSLEALPQVELPDAIVIDGDHNYYTVSQELRIIGERAAARLPLLLFHDVRWPHGRRDDYFDPEQIPADARHPLAGGEGLFPGEVRTRAGGLPYPRSAAREGGPRNGVLTAVEDFIATRRRLRLVVIPVFFGFAVAWDTEREWSDRIRPILDPFDRHPVLERLEANRIEHLARSYLHQAEVWELQSRLARQRAVLQRLLDSSAFAVAERLSRLRGGIGIAPEQSVVSKDEIRAALGD
jgi:hypothetical protein